MSTVYLVCWRVNRLERFTGDTGILPTAYAVDAEADAEAVRGRLAEPCSWWWVRPVTVVPARNNSMSAANSRRFDALVGLLGQPVRKGNMTDKEKAFLVGLEKLTRETGIVISGCGCCGSPALDECSDLPTDAGYGFGYAGQVAWISPNDEYDWEKYRANVVKANIPICLKTDGKANETERETA